MSRLLLYRTNIRAKKDNTACILCQKYLADISEEDTGLHYFKHPPHTIHNYCINLIDIAGIEQLKFIYFYAVRNNIIDILYKLFTLPNSKSEIKQIVKENLYFATRFNRLCMRYILNYDYACVTEIVSSILTDVCITAGQKREMLSVIKLGYRSARLIESKLHFVGINDRFSREMSALFLSLVNHG